MLRADLSPKPVYEQLRRLIHEEWRTRVEAVTDAEGGIAFRGLCGSYAAVLGHRDHKAERRFHVTKDRQNEPQLLVAP
jgi:hypothetical protein